MGQNNEVLFISSQFENCRFTSFDIQNLSKHDSHLISAQRIKDRLGYLFFTRLCILSMQHLDVDYNCMKLESFLTCSMISQESVTLRGTGLERNSVKI